MITKLEIKGFKSLVDVSIELGAVNVFIGANGSGKSNLLEAVGVLSAIISGSPEEETFRYRGVRTGQPHSFLSSLKNLSKKPISIGISGHETVYRVKISENDRKPKKWLILGESLIANGKPVFQRTDIGFDITLDGETTKVEFPGVDRPKSIAQDALFFCMMKLFTMPNTNQNPIDDSNGFTNVYKYSQSLLENIKRYCIYEPSTPQLRGFLDDIQREPLGLGGSGLSQSIIDMLCKEPDKLGPFDLDEVYELIDWADSLNIDETAGIGEATRLRIGDRFMGNGHKSVSLLEASEGALYVLFLLALVGHEDSPKFFAVDNFDQALHPRLALALTEKISDQILADGTRQMLATTHNPLVLDGLDLLDDRVRLFTVDRDQTGASQVKRVLVTQELIDKGFSLSRLWTSGRFGGVPRYL